MLELLARLISAIIMSASIFYIMSKIVYSKLIKINVRQVFLLFLIAATLWILSPIQYSGLYTISMFFTYVLFYKLIFKISIEESLISCGLTMIILFLSDIITSLVFMSSFSVNHIRTNSLLIVLTNSTVSILGVAFSSIRLIINQIHKFYANIKSNKVVSSILFFVLLIIDFSYLLSNIGISEFLKRDYIINFSVIFIFIIISYIFIQSKNDYNQLSGEYDNLFSYIQNFEDWIEREQLNRHEYKNQLAVLRCLTKEKKVKNKIDEILEDNINIEEQAVTNLKSLPKGGIKGLMYYKAAIAQKKKINLITDVSLKNKGILTMLSEKEMRILCKLIGIYFDNAIEAAAESRKKNIMIEVYELKDKVSFVFSNTFKNHKNMKDRNKKGVSSKGNGRGNGLYFAEKLIKENYWVEDKQEIIEGYYIQQLIIKKNVFK